MKYAMEINKIYKQLLSGPQIAFQHEDVHAEAFAYMHMVYKQACKT